MGLDLRTYLGEPAHTRANFLGTIWRLSAESNKSGFRQGLASISQAGFSYKDSLTIKWQHWSLERR